MYAKRLRVYKEVGYTPPNARFNSDRRIRTRDLRVMSCEKGL